MSIVVTAVCILRAIGLVAMGPLRGIIATYHGCQMVRKGAAILLVWPYLPIGLVPGWLVDLVGRVRMRS